nr:CsgG/HfaB family protein [Halonatronum saccharophilum]
MLSRYSKFISMILLVFIFISFVGADYVLAQELYSSSNQDSDSNISKGLGIGALITLGVWGIYRRVRSSREARYESNLERGQYFLDRGNYQLAINYLEEARAINDTTEVLSLLHEAQDKYKDYHYSQGIKYLEEENWELAYRYFNNVRRYDQNYLNVNHNYDQAYQKLREIKLKRMAVIEFEDTTYRTYRYNLGRRATSLFTAKLLSRDPKFIEVIERARLNQILEEQKLGASGLVDSSTAKDIGNILGVDFLVVGKVLSGSVTEDRNSQKVDVRYQDDPVTRTNVQKEAYTQIIFNILDVSNGAIVLSETIRERENFRTSYYQGESVSIPSDEEMIDDVLTKAVDRFAQIVYDRYEF